MQDQQSDVNEWLSGCHVSGTCKCQRERQECLLDHMHNKYHQFFIYQEHQHWFDKQSIFIAFSLRTFIASKSDSACGPYFTSLKSFKWLFHNNFTAILLLSPHSSIEVDNLNLQDRNAVSSAGDVEKTWCTAPNMEIIALQGLHVSYLPSCGNYMTYHLCD